MTSAFLFTLLATVEAGLYQNQRRACGDVQSFGICMVKCSAYASGQFCENEGYECCAKTARVVCRGRRGYCAQKCSKDAPKPYFCGRGFACCHALGNASSYRHMGQKMLATVTCSNSTMCHIVPVGTWGRK